MAKLHSWSFHSDKKIYALSTGVLSNFEGHNHINCSKFFCSIVDIVRLVVDGDSINLDGAIDGAMANP